LSHKNSCPSATLLKKIKVVKSYSKVCPNHHELPTSSKIVLMLDE
jgi:hypothetical protein